MSPIRPIRSVTCLAMFVAGPFVLSGCTSLFDTDLSEDLYPPAAADVDAADMDGESDVSDVADDGSDTPADVPSDGDDLGDDLGDASDVDGPSDVPDGGGPNACGGDSALELGSIGLVALVGELRQRVVYLGSSRFR